MNPQTVDTSWSLQRAATLHSESASSTKERPETTSVVPAPTSSDPTKPAHIPITPTTQSPSSHHHWLVVTAGLITVLMVSISLRLDSTRQTTQRTSAESPSQTTNASGADLSFAATSVPEIGELSEFEKYQLRSMAMDSDAAQIVEASIDQLLTAVIVEIPNDAVQIGAKPLEANSCLRADLASLVPVGQPASHFAIFTWLQAFEISDATTTPQKRAAKLAQRLTDLGFRTSPTPDGPERFLALINDVAFEVKVTGGQPTVVTFSMQTSCFDFTSVLP